MFFAPFLLMAFVATMGVALPVWLDVASGMIPADLVAVAAVGAWFASRRTRLVSLVPHFSWALGGYLFWCLLATLYWQAGTLAALGIVELAVIFGLTASLAQDVAGRDLLARTWVWSAAILCVVAIVGSLLTATGFATRLSATGGAFGIAARAQGLCRSPGMLGSLCIVPWVLLYDEGGRRLVGRFRTPLLVLVSLACALTLTRSILALGLAWCLFRPGRRCGIPLILVLLSLSIRFNIARPGVFPDFSAEPGLRLRIITNGLATLFRNPLFGVGPAGIAAQAGWPTAADPAHVWRLHMTVIDVATRFGAPAAIFLAAFVARVLRRAPAGVWRIALLAMLFDSLSIDLENFRHFWVLLGVAAALGTRYDGHRCASRASISEE